MKATSTVLAVFCLIYWVSGNLVSYQNGTYRSPRVFNMEGRIKDFIMEQSRLMNKRVEWYDLHGENPKNPNKKPGVTEQSYKIVPRLSPLVYGDLTSAITRPSKVFSQWFHNESPSATHKTTIKRETTTQKTAHWFLESGISFGLSLKKNIGFLPFFNFEISFEAKLDLRTGGGGTHSESQTFSIEQEITIPANRSVKTDWVITEKVFDAPWTCDTHFEGYFLVGFSDQVVGFPTNFLVNEDLTPSGRYGVKYRTRGVFNGVTGTESSLRISEYPLIPQEYRSSADRLKPLNVRYYSADGTLLESAPF